MNDETAMVARDVVAGAGGVVNLAAIAEKFGVSKQRAGQLADHPTFPEPLPGDSTVKVWLWGEVSEWRDERQHRYGNAETPV
jgi:hypothetical protein